MNKVAIMKIISSFKRNNWHKYGFYWMPIKMPSSEKKKLEKN